MLLSVKQYAQHAGITQAAAYKRIHAGQLGDGVERHAGRYLIHPQRADAAWAIHSKPCNSRAAQLEQRLMAVANDLAVELTGQSEAYYQAALWRMVDRVIRSDA